MISKFMGGAHSLGSGQYDNYENTQNSNNILCFPYVWTFSRIP